ncbi:hypothetical protein CY0110_17822 [Crocosphaera chwakensis CCY0110]|uniref:Uncharacterized protein n=1 Tax=Crocosphaera chwakensis CCY0110 TaxID=391612 RepID=A3IIP6_9CHRO|nr:hypothetical protein CY0110_17822 [Crocosphaera chwakensis CCY0110]
MVPTFCFDVPIFSTSPASNFK